MTDEEKLAVAQSLKKGDEVDLTIRAMVCETKQYGTFLQVIAYSTKHSESYIIANGALDDFVAIRKVEP